MDGIIHLRKELQARGKRISRQSEMGIMHWFSVTSMNVHGSVWHTPHTYLFSWDS